MNSTIINWDAALGRVAGNKTLLIRICDIFTQQWSEARTKFHNFQGDPIRLEREIHTLKGVAGNIGAETLHSQCAHALNELRNAHTLSPDTLEALCSSAEEAVDCARNFR